MKFSKASKMKRRDVAVRLSGQDVYTLHKAVREMFQRNSYSEKNIEFVWEMDFSDLSSLSKYKNKYRYLLNVIDDKCNK
jgi:hypothetical protein